MKVTVCISDSGDERLARTLFSLSRQVVPVDEVLIEQRGSVAGSRNLMYQEATGDIIAFIDTDQELPPWWLMGMLPWVVLGWVDFVCGPTRPHPSPKHVSSYNEYLAELETRHYALARHDQTSFPMGNSLWSRKVLDALAAQNHGKPFDERLNMSGEDYDVNLRATKLGYIGIVVPHGWVWHDQSSLNNPLKIMRRKLRYCYGGAMAMLKNSGVQQKTSKPQPGYDRWLLKQLRVGWLEIFQKVAQAWGLLYATLARRFRRDWRRAG
jgi:hypothetical protein